MATYLQTLLAVAITLLCVVEGDKCPRRCTSCKSGVAECSKRSLVAPPKDFPSDTRVIILDSNHLRVIGKRSFQKLPKLEVLRMRGNKVRVVKKSAFAAFPSLMTLDLSENQLVKIYSKGFEGMDKLQTLSLQNNQIRSIARIFDTTKRLFQLNLAFNNIRVLGKKDLQTPTRIHYLDLRGNRIRKIHPEAFANLQYLRYLFLQNNPLVNVPDLVFGSSVLQLADFSNCKLTRVPHTMPASLSEFRLSENKIRQINDSDFQNITNLRLLAINDNKLHFVANGAFRHLDKLDEIWLRNNQLVYIPRGLPDNLRKIYMDSNVIQEIEGGLFSNNSRLDYLTVENNKIMRIRHNTFTGLKFLKSLNFRRNKLRVIETGTFESLRNLSSLSLSDNPLEKIEPDAFMKLENLTYLQMSMCGEQMSLQQNFLPEMPNLQQLILMNSPGLAKAFVKLLAETYTRPLEFVSEVDLTYNDLETISPNLREVFPALKGFYLDGNPWLCDKRLTWLREWMTTSDISFSQYEEVICEQPYSLKGRPIKDVAEDDFAEVAPPTKPPSPEEMSEMLSQQEQLQAANEAVASQDNAVAEKTNVKPLAMVDSPVATTTPKPVSPTTARLRRRRKYRHRNGKRQRKGKRSGDAKGKKSDSKGKRRRGRKGKGKKRRNRQPAKTDPQTVTQ